jgi:hypothetical protein
VRISSIARAKGIKADTIVAWLREAVLHAGRVEDVLLLEYQLSRTQIDGLWVYVGHKGKKGGTTTTTTTTTRTRARTTRTRVRRRRRRRRARGRASSGVAH